MKQKRVVVPFPEQDGEASTRCAAAAAAKSNTHCAHPTTPRLAVTSAAVVPTVRQAAQTGAAPPHQEEPPIDMDGVI